MLQSEGCICTIRRLRNSEKQNSNGSSVTEHLEDIHFLPFGNLFVELFVFETFIIF